ncbi:MAG: type IV pilin protein [Pseudomonadota bacterium]
MANLQMNNPHQHPCKRKRSHTGFSLVELLMAVCIVSILGAIAFPAYTSYLARGFRAEARAQLQLAAQYMQRFHAANDSYAADRAGKGIGEIMPPQFMQSPAQGQPVYRIEFVEGQSTASATGFRLVMSPVAGGRMAADECGGFSLDSFGRRGITGGGSREACWR